MVAKLSISKIYIRIGGLRFVIKEYNPDNPTWEITVYEAIDTEPMKKLIVIQAEDSIRAIFKCRHYAETLGHFLPVGFVGPADGS